MKRVVLDEIVAYHVGLLLAAARASDVVDGHVAILARSLDAISPAEAEYRDRRRARRRDRLR